MKWRDQCKGYTWVYMAGFEFYFLTEYQLQIIIYDPYLNRTSIFNSHGESQITLHRIVVLKVGRVAHKSAVNRGTKSLIALLSE